MQCSLPFTNYSLKQADEFNKILLNHVTNFLTRHYNDKVVISLYEDNKVIAQTSFEMSNLMVQSGKTHSFVLIATGVSDKNMKPLYYKFELDINFRARTIKSNSLSKLE